MTAQQGAAAVLAAAGGVIKLTVLVGLLGPFGSPARASHKALVCCADGSPEAFDPALWDSIATRNVTSQIFDGLLGFERGTSTLTPELASGWTVSPDATPFTFALRRGVKLQTPAAFKPTRELNADDEMIAGTGRLDDHTMRFRLRSSVVISIRKGLQGFQMSPNGSVSFDGVSRR
ncbi:MAG: hypothetical protein ABIN96_13025 [Rubrivivax sp.]